MELLLSCQSSCPLNLQRQPETVVASLCEIVLVERSTLHHKHVARFYFSLTGVWSIILVTTSNILTKNRSISWFWSSSQNEAKTKTPKSKYYSSSIPQSVWDFANFLTGVPTLFALVNELTTSNISLVKTLVLWRSYSLDQDIQTLSEAENRNITT